MNHSSLQPKIGIVSGVGPLAGSDVLAKVLKNAAILYGAVEDSEYPDIVFVNHGIEGVDNVGTLNDTFEKEIVSMVQQLESQGATVIGIACNTAHIYLDKIKVGQDTVLVNLIDAVAAKAATADDKYLLLSSSTSKKQKLYHSYLQKHGVSFQETTHKQQKLLDKAIGLVMAYELNHAGKILEQVLLGAKANGFTAVIAGCTELPIAIDHGQIPKNIKVIDSNQVLAQCLITDYYKGDEKRLPLR